MYLRRFTIEHVRAVTSFEMEFDRGREAGWHVILGSNGAGKSSVIRAFALLMMGQKEAYASRQVFSNWIAKGEQTATISAHITWDEQFDSLTRGGQPPKKAITPNVTLSREDFDFYDETVDVVFGGDLVTRTIWGGGPGWFSSSFGPFRRFTGGDRIYDRLFVSNKRLAPHLTALGEDVALTEAVDWLSNLYVEQLQLERQPGPSTAPATLEMIEHFLNSTGFLPFGATLAGFGGNTIFVRDGSGHTVALEQLSDGYRSAMSLALELMRQMIQLYGADKILTAYDRTCGAILAPGVVAIDEIDVHLHPTWQRDIGWWLTERFPNVQFLVTTHSPIICRAVANRKGEIRGSVWKLPQPGEATTTGGRVQGVDLDQLVFGDVLDAFSTELFGSNVAQAPVGAHKVARLAELNQKALIEELSVEERAEQRQLRAIFPAASGDLGQ